MKQITKTLMIGALAILGLSGLLQAQTSLQGQSSEVFASENAIIDTAIPFAIGAREAQQSLRGSYGWPTFQEGLVEGVYFRFDPDGYARFSPNPRLDVDVFEVICKARTNLCMARKDSLNMFLNDRGHLQLKFESVTPNDMFFISEGISEIQIPTRILQPLDSQLETLLATGDELIVRRGGEEISKTSLKGFVATVSFLRWIQADQDYAVLPRDWPVPNSNTQVSSASGLTTSNWRSPTPQPHFVQPTGVPLSNGSHEIEAELRELRRAIRDLSVSAGPSTAAETSQPTNSAQPSQADALMEVADKLQAELDRLQANQLAPTPTHAPQEMPRFPEPTTDYPALDNTLSAGQKIEYLMRELGLDMRTAVAVIEMAEQGTQPLQQTAQQSPASIATTPTDASMPQSSLVDQILKELEAEISADVPLEEPVMTPPLITVQEYQLISSYFRSVALPPLEAMHGTTKQ